jgi:acetyltransferase-like isoleucine patch superfamily enzyme
VILPGVTLGRGCIVGSRTIVADDVAPYAVVVGDPARVVRYLDADDTPEARQAILLQHGRR